MSTPDMALLREFAASQSESAFEQIVARHVNMVYSTALRRAKDTHLAEEVTQAVFVILARKARSLGPATIISGWLYRTTRFVAADALKSQHRRQQREQEAYMQSRFDETQSDGPDEVWQQIAPLLETAMDSLNEGDRTAVVQRFLQGKSLSEVGAGFGVTEDAARMRVGRALEKLRKFFTKRGLALSAAAISGALSVNSVQAAPAGLAATIAATAVKSAVARSSTLALVKGALKLMAWTKAKTAMAIGIGILLATGTATVTVKIIKERNMDDSWRSAYFNSSVLDRLPPELKILPAKLPRMGGWGTSNGKRMGTGIDAVSLVRMAYDFGSSVRTIRSADLPKDTYDFIASLPSGNAEELQREIRRQFKVTARRESIETNVLFLTVKVPNAEGLRMGEGLNRGSSQRTEANRYFSVNQPISFLAGFLENSLQVPVIDKTGLGETFDIDLNWDSDDPRHKSLKQVLLQQLGLELVPGREPVEMLIIEKAP